jgi:hypothetical protein
MRRGLATVTAILLVLIFPASASAFGFLEWLDRLSGPGPFWGFNLELELKCFGGVPPPPPPPPPGITVAPPTALRMPVDESCRKAKLIEHKFTWMVTPGFAISENNPLDYGDTGHQDTSTAVRLIRGGTSLDYRIDQAVEIGAGAGLFYFNGPRFNDFVRAFVQPARLTLRPLLLVPKWRRDDEKRDHRGWLLLEINWLLLLGTIDGADFGAPADPWRTSNENQLEVGLSIDVYRLFKR